MKIEHFKPLGGHHCITNSLKQIFNYYGHTISEEMIFGLGKGLGFVYVNLGNSPMISCRIKPFEFEENLADSLGIEIKIKTTKNNDIALDKLKKSIDDNIPLMLYADMAYLDYMNLDENSHFGGHSIVVFGYDNEQKLFYVSDRDNDDFKVHTPKGEIGDDYHLISFERLSLARSSAHRPFPANNKWMEFNMKNLKPIDSQMIKAAIIANLSEVLNAPAQLLGINGINKFAKEIKKWEKFGDEKFRLSGITNYFMINEKGGTGGGAFRRIYGNFLKEASNYIPELKNFGEEYLVIGEKWENIASDMMKIYEFGDKSFLENTSKKISEIAENEEILIKNILEVLKV